MKCKNDCCIAYTQRDISKLVDKVNYEITITSELRNKQLNFGFFLKKNFDKILSKLSLAQYLLNNKLDSLVNDYKYCLCDCKIQKFVETISFTKKSRLVYSTITDKSEEETWIVNNKLCVSKEKWEECVCDYIQRLGLEFTVEEQVSNLVYDISVTPVLKDIIYEITSILKPDITFKKTVDIKNIETEFEKLVSTTNTDLSFKTYGILINKGLDFDIINKSINNDLSFSISGEEDQISLCTRNCNYPIP